MFLRGSSTRYRDSSSRAHFLKKFLPLSYGQCLKSARFITIYRWYALSYFFENKPPFMADAIAINLFTSPLPRQWCKKVSRKIWNSLGLSTIFTTTNLLFSIFEKQNSLSYSWILKKETPFVSTSMLVFLVAIKKTDAWCFVWMRQSVISAFISQRDLTWKF